MDFTGINCPVCSVGFKEDDDIVVCPKCGAPYHRECYAQKGKCIFPELHKNGKSWRSENGYADEPEESIETDDFIICRHCGCKNSKDSIVCEQCGDFLFGPVRRTIDPFGIAGDDEEDEDDDPMKSASPFYRTNQFYVNGVRIFDLGFNKDDDFDGVSGEELAQEVGPNPLDYLPVFSSLKKRNVSRFNCAVFLFGGGWYIYRKQYWKGIIVLLINTLLYAGNLVVSELFADNMWSQATAALTAASGSTSYNPGYGEYFSWIAQNCTLTEGFLMLLPYIFGLLNLVMMFICGFNANRGYYKNCIRKIKKIKEQNPGEDKKELLRLLAFKGRTNIGLAWMLMACQVIILSGLMLYNP